MFSVQGAQSQGASMHAVLVNPVLTPGFKCDEKTPQCSHCARWNVKCSLMFVKAERQLSQPEEYLTTVEDSRDLALIAPHQPLPLPSGVNLQDLELMHHFTTVTYTGFVDNTKLANMWQNEAPRVAIRFPFLMHGILAVSALHLSYLQPEKKKTWITKALQHETAGLPSVRSAMEQLDEENCHALFAFSGLVVPFKQALTAHESSTYWELEAISKWFPLLRGAHNILCASWEWLPSGPFASMLRPTNLPIDSTLNPDDPFLTSLYSLLIPHENASIEEVEDLRVVRAALDQLRRISAMPHQTCRPTGYKAPVFMWPGGVSQEYMVLVENRVPEALIVLGFYSLVVQRAGISWLMEDNGASYLLRSIEACLGEDWLPWLDYPRRQVYEDATRKATNHLEESNGSIYETDPSSDQTCSISSTVPSSPQMLQEPREKGII